MAVIDYDFDNQGDRSIVTWETLTCGDTGRVLDLNNFNDNTVTATGTFNSENLTMQGSNDGTVWFTLTDPTGVGVVFSAAGGKVLVEAPRYIRPSFSGASGGDVDVLVLLRKS